MVTFPDYQKGYSGQLIVNHVETIIESFYKGKLNDDVIDEELMYGLSENEDLGRYSLRSNQITNNNKPNRPIIPPMIELHLIQLGNKLSPQEAKLAKERFTRSLLLLNPKLQQDLRNSLIREKEKLKPKCCDCNEDQKTSSITVEHLVTIMKNIMLNIIEDKITTSLLKSRISKHKFTRKPIIKPSTTKTGVEVAIIPNRSEDEHQFDNMASGTSVCPSAHIALHLPYTLNSSLEESASSTISTSSTSSSSSSNSSSSSSSTSSISSSILSSPISPLRNGNRNSESLLNKTYSNDNSSLTFYNSSVEISPYKPKVNNALDSELLTHLDNTRVTINSEATDHFTENINEMINLAENKAYYISKSTQCDFPEEEPKIVTILNKSKQFCTILTQKKVKKKNKKHSQQDAGNDFHRRLNSVLRQSTFRNNNADSNVNNNISTEVNNDDSEQTHENSAHNQVISNRPDPDDNNDQGQLEPSVSIINPFEDPDLDLDQLNEEDDPYNLTFDFSLPSSEDSSPHRFIFNSRYTVYTISGSLANSVNNHGRYSFKSLSTAHL